jgi:heme/copper-type cytochrome/quinol oxidase subunit 3
MNKRKLALWFRVVSIILMFFGLLYVFFGLRIFSDNVGLIPHDVLLPWESALYGAIMLGWGTTLLLVGRIAFRRDDAELKRALLLGIAAWLTVEAAASAWFGVWFNVGVDLAVLALFAVPLLRRR